MSNSSGFALSRSSGSDRFYSPPVMRKNRKQQQRRRLEPDMVEPDSRTDSDEPALPKTANSSNLDSLLASLTPSVPARFFSEPKVKGRRRESNGGVYFVLEDLWEFFREWSAYGVEVPLIVNEGDTIKQYYVPYLSAIQLYALRRLEDSGADSSKETSSDGSSDNEADKQARGGNLMNINSQRLSRLAMREKTRLSSSNDETEVHNSPEQLIYEYFEGAPPHVRPPFHDKASPVFSDLPIKFLPLIWTLVIPISSQVSVLASAWPSLTKYRSCDITPSSWFSVAWYPIYRIPVGSTLKSLDASFLTFHTFSAHSRRKNQPQSHASSDKVHGVDGSLSISLPAFGLASYKLRGSILTPNEASEWRQVNSLLKAADDWLQKLQVKHPDYQYFVSHSPRGR